MNRRSFLRFVPAIPFCAVGASSALASAKLHDGGVVSGKPISIELRPGETLLSKSEYANFSRISCVRGDPGEIAYGMISGDGKMARVFLDGVESKHAVTVDTKEGYVVRHIMTPNGNVAVNRAAGEVLQETVYGDVEVVITERSGRDAYRKFAKSTDGQVHSVDGV